MASFVLLRFVLLRFVALGTVANTVKGIQNERRSTVD
jgi:hypothetical protein